MASSRGNTAVDVLKQSVTSTGSYPMLCLPRDGEFLRMCTNSGNLSDTPSEQNISIPSGMSHARIVVRIGVRIGVRHEY